MKLILPHLRCITSNQFSFTIDYLAYINAIQMRHNHLSARMFVAISYWKCAISSQLTSIAHQFECDCNTNKQTVTFVQCAPRMVLSYGSSILKKQLIFWALAPSQLMLTIKETRHHTKFTHTLWKRYNKTDPQKKVFQNEFSYHVKLPCYEGFQQDSFLLAFVIHQPRRCNRGAQFKSRLCHWQHKRYFVIFL